MATSSDLGAAGPTAPPPDVTPGTFISPLAVGFLRGAGDVRPAGRLSLPPQAFYRALHTIKLLVPDEASGLIISHLPQVEVILAQVERGVIQAFLTAQQEGLR